MTPKSRQAVRVALTPQEDGLQLSFTVPGGSLTIVLGDPDARANGAACEFECVRATGRLALTRVVARELAAARPELAILAGLLRRELHSTSPRDTALIDALASSFVGYFSRALAGDAPRVDASVARALELLRGDPARRWTVAALAKAVGLSRPVLARRFRQAVGASPLRYLNGLRLDLAAELLVDTDASLSEVALRVGYVSEFAFSRAFKRHHRMPPGAFRRARVTTGRPVAGLTLLCAAA